MRSFAFVWENLGPTHEDRLAALARRHPDRVFAIQLSRSSHVYQWEGGAAHAVPSATLFDDPCEASSLRCVYRLIRAVRRTGAREVFLCEYQRWTMLLSAIVLRLLGYRVVAMIDSKFDDYTRSLWREVGKSFFLAPYSAALTASDRSREYLRFLGFRRRPVALGYDALSVDRIRAQSPGPPAPGGTPHAERHFLVIARLVEKKNVAAAIRAYAEWREGNPAPRKLVILGSGPLEAELRTLAAALGVADGVVFEGFVQTGRVSAALADALCLLLPSVEEQFGLVVIEAMAMGVPVLVSSNAGAVDVMLDNGVSGWVVDPHRTAAMVAAMARLADDEAEWRAMAEAAQAHSLRGDVTAFVDGVESLA